ncbi:MAG: hypothetical protein Q4Q33_08700 [Eubacteriales bacterium]|nr:hypothetical protein [Eubacteriales bacterium]
MRFTKEVNIYAGGALKKFQALEVEFKVTKKGISSLISESELRELQSGSKTMYSRMASAEQTISGLSQEYTDISSKYDTISGQYTDLNSKVGEYKAEVDNFSVSLSQLSNHIEKDYSTTHSMNAFIQLTINNLKTELSDTYVTQDYLKDYSTVEQVSAAIEASTTKIFAEVRTASYYNYCTNGDFNDGSKEGWKYSILGLKTVEYLNKTCAVLLNSDNVMDKANNSYFITWEYNVDKKQKNEIKFQLASQNSGNIKVYLDDTEILSVEKKDIITEWKEFSVEAMVKEGSHTFRIQVEDKEKRVYVTGVGILAKYKDWTEGRLSILSDSISTEIERASDAEESLTTKIQQTETSINLKVSKGSIISEINQTAESASINAAKINFNGLVTANDYFKINTDGSFVANYGTLATWNVKNDIIISTDKSISLYGGDNPYIKIGNVKLSEDSHAAVVKYGLWIYAGTNHEFTDGSDQFRLYNLTAVTGKTLGIASDRHVGTIASSSKRYKSPRGLVSAKNAYKMLKLPVVQFKYKAGYLHKNDDLYNKTIPGFYAEEIADILPEAVIHDDQGRPEDWNQRILIPLMLKLIQDMNQRIKELENK